MGNASSGGLAYVPSTGGGGNGAAITISGNTAGAGALVSSGTVAIAGGNNITISQNGQSISIIGGAGGAGFSAGVSGGNTSGTTGITGTQLVLAGGNNITLSQATGAGGATVTISQSQAIGIGAIQASNTTYNSGTVILSNANGLTFGSSAGGAITASYNSTQFAGTGTSVTGNAAVTLNSNGIQFNGAGLAGTSTGATNASVTLNSSGIAISVAAGGGGGWELSAGASSQSTGTIVFSNSNNISFGLSTGAAAAGTVTASFSQSNQTVGVYASSQTTGSASSYTYDARSLSIIGAGGISIGNNSTSAGGTTTGIVISAPAVSSVVGAGQISISTAGSTITLSAASYGTLSYWDNGLLVGSATASQLGLGSVVIQQMSLDANLSISALREFISGSFSVTNSSFGNTVSLQAGIYTLTGSTLSLATSGSQSYGLTNTSNVSASIYTGIKGVTIPLGASLTPGNYWLGLWSSTASSGFNYATFSNVVQYEGPLTYNGLLGSSAAASNQSVLGGGLWSTTSAALPASIGLSQITGSVGNISPFVNLYNVSA